MSSPQSAPQSFVLHNGPLPQQQPNKPSLSHALSPSPSPLDLPSLVAVTHPSTVSVISMGSLSTSTTIDRNDKDLFRIILDQQQPPHSLPVDSTKNEGHQSEMVLNTCTPNSTAATNTTSGTSHILGANKNPSVTALQHMQLPPQSYAPLGLRDAPQLQALLPPPLPIRTSMRSPVPPSSIVRPNLSEPKHSKNINNNDPVKIAIASYSLQHQTETGGTGVVDNRTSNNSQNSKNVSQQIVPRNHQQQVHKGGQSNRNNMLISTSNDSSSTRRSLQPIAALRISKQLTAQLKGAASPAPAQTGGGGLIFQSPRCDQQDSELFPSSAGLLQQRELRWRFVQQQAGPHQQDLHILRIQEHMTPAALRGGIPPSITRRIRHIYLPECLLVHSSSSLTSTMESSSELNEDNHASSACTVPRDHSEVSCKELNSDHGSEYSYHPQPISATGLPEWLDVISELFVNLQHLDVIPTRNQERLESHCQHQSSEEDGSSRNGEQTSHQQHHHRILRRLYVLYRLPDLVTIDGVPVSNKERLLAKPPSPIGQRVQRDNWMISSQNHGPPDPPSPPPASPSAAKAVATASINDLPITKANPAAIVSLLDCHAEDDEEAHGIENVKTTLDPAAMKPLASFDTSSSISEVTVLYSNCTHRRRYSDGHESAKDTNSSGINDLPSPKRATMPQFAMEPQREQHRKQQPQSLLSRFPMEEKKEQTPIDDLDRLEYMSVATSQSTIAAAAACGWGVGCGGLSIPYNSLKLSFRRQNPNPKQETTPDRIVESQRRQSVPTEVKYSQSSAPARATVVDSEMSSKEPGRNNASSKAPTSDRISSKPRVDVAALKSSLPPLSVSLLSQDRSTPILTTPTRAAPIMKYLCSKDAPTLHNAYYSPPPLSPQANTIQRVPASQSLTSPFPMQFRVRANGATPVLAPSPNRPLSVTTKLNSEDVLPNRPSPPPVPREHHTLTVLHTIEAPVPLTRTQSSPSRLPGRAGRPKSDLPPPRPGGLVASSSISAKVRTSVSSRKRLSNMGSSPLVHRWAKKKELKLQAARSTCILD